MRKLWQLLTNNILKIGISATIIFTALYPKLPSIQITHTWVYVRLEDFLITAVVVLWLFLLIRKKARIYFPESIPILIYWLVGFLSLGFSLIFIAPHLANFFPKIAALQYLRRIEYMILFFVAASTIKSLKDLRDYVAIIAITVFGIVIYGIGQHFYLFFWNLFPSFFEKYPFCFPSFQTGNEEFAKGIPLCLPSDGRTTSTFGGHYDLAAYLVIVIPILLGMMLSSKKIIHKIMMGVLFLSSVTLLIFTASRSSFITYLVGIVAALIFMKRKILIAPIIIISIALLLIFSGSTAKRFLETFRFISIVTNSQGQVVGMTQASLPENLRNKISKNPIVIGEAPPTQNLPEGSSYINLLQAPTATSVAVVKSSLSQKEAERLQLQFGGLEISTISGTFLIRKALVYDISFTTRFQAEWPNAWKAFMRNPPLGSGYSSITLATDGDYVRFLGESGFLGLGSFLFIFLIFGIYLKQILPHINSKFAKYFIFGLAGGIIGLFVNAILIDVFEASKVAEPLWILLGIGMGVLKLYQKDLPTNYLTQLKNFFTTKTLIAIELFVFMSGVFMGSIYNFFVGDDFTWLKWAATATTSDLGKYFYDANGFFYRPLDKVIMFLLYNFSSFQPAGYHLFTLLLYFLMSIGIFFLGLRIFKSKLWAFLASALFLMVPSHGESIFWISTISVSLSSVFILFALLSYIKSRTTKLIPFYIVAIILQILALLSYEMAVIFPLLLIATDLFLLRNKKIKNLLNLYIVPILLDIAYLFVHSSSHAVSIGGDYSYNLLHLPTNIIGNFLGYYGLFFFGNTILPIYDSLRIHTKLYALPLGIVVILGVIGLVFLLRKQKISTILNNKSWLLVIYGIVFSFVCLIPYLGLGNITERYTYLASVGEVIAVIAVSQMFFAKIAKSGKKYLILGAVILIVFFSYLGLLNKEKSEWSSAGMVTRLTLAYFRVEQGGITEGSKIIFVNVPIRKANAWIFPVGLPDALWFIYRDDTQKVYSVKTIEEAKSLAETLGSQAYIFVFDKDGNISKLE